MSRAKNAQTKAMPRTFPYVASPMSSPDRKEEEVDREAGSDQRADRERSEPASRETREGARDRGSGLKDQEGGAEAGSERRDVAAGVEHRDEADDTCDSHGDEHDDDADIETGQARWARRSFFHAPGILGRVLRSSDGEGPSRSRPLTATSLSSSGGPLSSSPLTC